MKYNFFKCECNSEGVLIESDDDFYYISLFNKYYHDGKLCLIDRIKYGIKVLFTGKIYSDQVVINKLEGRNIANFLLDTGTDLTQVNSYTVDEYNIQDGKAK